MRLDSGRNNLSNPCGYENQQPSLEIGLLREDADELCNIWCIGMIHGGFWYL
ncbi:hypothetical protein SLEP1_g8015 [Rubroshorea leprosula]|uniref:Uncharacterized protein n=1 Tax=Rubroshorea leprosula TaxID=152421 RepID=A0AAV5IA71_9ROSI|nr:hypothetical protein SLEP1_g8015 [Rubroshorea leprosula]